MKWKCSSECPYKHYPKIPPSKLRKTDLAIVGEAPGISEIARKRPFVGPTGEVLGKTLEAAGLPSKDEAFLTNALLCRPPKGDRIKVEAINYCRSRVLEELRQVEPEVVLVLGSSALKAMLGKSNASITRRHSKVFRRKDVPGAIFVPAFHPAALFRRPGDYRTYIKALIYASIILQQGSDAIRDPGNTEYRVLDTPKKVVEKLEKWRNTDNPPVLAADIETGGFNQFEDPILCLGICVEERLTYIIPIEDLEPGKHKYDNVLAQVPNKYFEDPGLRWCWHDGSFDTPFLMNNDIPAQVNHDTILLHYCLDEHAGGHDLETLAMRFLGAEAYEKHVKDHAQSGRGYRDVPKKVLYPYLGKDCDYTKRLFNMFWPKVRDDENLSKLYHKVLIPATGFLRRLFLNGIYVNKPYTKKLDKKLEKQENRVLAKIRKEIGYAWDSKKYKEQTGAKSAGTDGNEQLINPNSPKQLAWVLFDAIGLPSVRGRGRSTDKEVLGELEDKHPAVPYIIQYRSLKKKRGTYVKGILKRIHKDGRIHSRYSLYRSVTGRLSSRNPKLKYGA